jgi:hypothetical protein
MSKKIEKIRTAIHFCFGMFLSVIVVEAFYRVVEQTPAWVVLPVIQKEAGRPDSQFGYRLKSGAEFIQVEETRSRVKINSVGLRDRETSIEKPIGVTRIGLLGNSITMGVHVPWLQTADAVLEENLRKSADFEVLNFAQNGGSLPQMLEIAKAFQPKFDVDIFAFNYSVFSFLGSPMFDEGLLPGYRETNPGQWEMGYKFKDRSSVLQQDTFLGKSFYFLMDNSRVAWGIYRLNRQGIFLQNSGWSKPTTDLGECDNKSLLSAIEVWSEESSSRHAQVRKQFLTDVSTLRDTTSAEFVFAWSSLTNRNRNCPNLDKYYADLKERVDLAMRHFGFLYTDVSASEEYEVAIDEREIRQLTGFGANLGEGHLNKYGHEVRARVLYAFLAPIFAVEKFGDDR